MLVREPEKTRDQPQKAWKIPPHCHTNICHIKKNRALGVCESHISSFSDLNNKENLDTSQTENNNLTATVTCCVILVRLMF